MKIIRREYVRSTNEYCLEIDAQYLEELSGYINKEMLNPADNIALTEQDIVDIFNSDYGDKWNKNVLVRAYWKEDNSSVSVVLGDYVREYIDEDIWDCDFFVWDSDSDGFDDEIVRD